MICRSREFISLMVVIILVLLIAFDLSTIDALGEGTDFSYVGRDLATRGDWIGSRYGECGYALPYAQPPLTEVAVGETTGIGESAHYYWWREPWSVPGEKGLSL